MAQESKAKSLQKGKKKKSAGVFDGSVAGAVHLTHDMLLDEIQPEKEKKKTPPQSHRQHGTRGTAGLQSALITEE